MKRLEQGVVEQWLGLISGQFTTRDIWHELGIVSSEGKHLLRTILWRLEEKKIVVSLGRGTYRKIDPELKPVEWQSADLGKVLPLKFPFELERYFRIYPKSIVVLAGEKNVGKTTWLYNFVKLNMNDFQIDLYNSETGPEQMLERFLPLEIPTPAPFKVYERYDNFADIIHPDHISVIDYLDVGSETYMVGAEIDSIFRALTTGVAVIGLQKPPTSTIFVRGKKVEYSRDLAYGGAFSAKRAVLYISLSNNKLKLVYVKMPRIATVNPNNMQWSFQINHTGSHFINVKRINEDTLALEQ